MFVLALFLALAIGVSLGLLGSGGSIITLPVLVYAAKVPATQAVAMSLAVVGGTTLVGSILNARSGQIHAKAALLFSVTGVIGALGGSQLTDLVRPSVLLLIFAGLMLVVGLLMFRPRANRGVDARRSAIGWAALRPASSWVSSLVSSASAAVF